MLRLVRIGRKRQFDPRTQVVEVNAQLLAIEIIDFRPAASGPQLISRNIIERVTLFDNVRVPARLCPTANYVHIRSAGPPHALARAEPRILLPQHGQFDRRALVDQIQQTCQTADLKPRRLILRPCATASLLGRSATRDAQSRLRLLVDLFRDEADLTVMVDRKVVFLRTTRLSGDPLTESDHAKSLLAEIHRTMAAAQNQLGGRRVEAIVLCGSGEEHAALARSIEERLSTPTTLFDPLEGLKLSRELRRNLPEHPGRFAPLLGMALAELEQASHAIDFLHPRRRPEPVGQQTKYVLIGLAVALLVVAYFGFGWWQRSSLQNEIRQLTADSKALNNAVTRANGAKEAVAEIEKWTATDVVWLDELRSVSEDFPPAQEAMLTRLFLSSRGSVEGGRMMLDGLARDSDAITNTKQCLCKDPSRDIESGNSDQDDKVKPYLWRFKATVTVRPEKP